MRIVTNVLFICVLIGVLSSCKSAKEEPECEPAPAPAPAQTEAKEPLKKQTVVVSPKDADWCRACVVGPKGYMSCQKIDGAGGAEGRRGLRARARLSACLDSGFTEQNCPKESVMAIVCKGDSEPGEEQKKETARKVLKALNNSGPLVLKKPASDNKAKSAPPAAPPKAKDAPPTKNSTGTQGAVQ